MPKNPKNHPEVAVVMGSDSDWPAMQACVKTLADFKIGWEARVISAHRTPQQAATFAANAERRGLKIIIAAAGHAAHLAGVLAAHTILPVIGVPMKGGAVDGLDALLAMVQMPGGVPVATVALSSGGPVNAALLAVQMLALHRPELAQALRRHKLQLAKKVVQADRRLQAQIKELA